MVKDRERVCSYVAGCVVGGYIVSVEWCTWLSWPQERKFNTVLPCSLSIVEVNNNYYESEGIVPTRLPFLVPSSSPQMNYFPPLHLI